MMQIIQLSPFDQICKSAYIRYVLCLRCDDAMREAQKLRWRALVTELVKVYPFLTGKVIDPGPQGRRELHFETQISANYDPVAHGVLRVEELSLSYDDLEKSGFAPSMLRTEQVHWLPPTPSPTEQPVFAVQANFIHGGLLLATWWHHSVFDGMGTCNMLRSLGHVVQQMISGTTEELGPQISGIGKQSFHRTQTSHVVDPDEIEELAIKDADSVQSLSTKSQSPTSPREKVISRIFLFRIRDVQRILRSNGRTASPFRCVIALLTVAILRVRSALRDEASKYDQRYRLFIPVNIRTALNIPSDFLGNSVHGKFMEWNDIDSLQTDRRLEDFPNCLTLALDRICAAIDAVKQPTFMAQRLAFINRQLENNAPDKLVELNLRVDTNSLICNSWEDIGKTCGGINFEALGLGTLGHVRRPYTVNSGAMLVLPRLPDSQFIEIDVGLPEREMDGLFKELEGWRQRGWLVDVLR